MEQNIELEEHLDEFVLVVTGVHVLLPQCPHCWGQAIDVCSPTFEFGIARLWLDHGQFVESGPELVLCLKCALVPSDVRVNLQEVLERLSW